MRDVGKDGAYTSVDEGMRETWDLGPADVAVVEGCEEELGECVLVFSLFVETLNERGRDSDCG